LLYAVGHCRVLRTLRVRLAAVRVSAGWAVHVRNQRFLDYGAKAPTLRQWEFAGLKAPTLGMTVGVWGEAPSLGVLWHCF
jgi:hypothetical protein